uniref:Uncharacterized protein n=1 Tax=uncultured marine virus TaxID=186617 RepID=A0A0F7L7K0_9VIRU|nr:hypothetical protein [uncultured marine virus]
MSDEDIGAENSGCTTGRVCATIGVLASDWMLVGPAPEAAPPDASTLIPGSPPSPDGGPPKSSASLPGLPCGSELVPGAGSAPRASKPRAASPTTANPNPWPSTVAAALTGVGLKKLDLPPKIPSTGAGVVPSPSSIAATASCWATLIASSPLSKP